MIITNLQNPQVKDISALKKKKYREAANSFLIEGVRFVEEALASNAPVTKVLFTADLQNGARGQNLLDLIIQGGIPALEVSEAVLKKISDTETPQGIVAVVKMLTDDAASFPETGLALLIDGVQDPGNMGTILRTADAAGVSQVWVTPGTVDVYNPKTLRATMGSIFHLSVVETLPEPLLHQLKVAGWQLVVADVKGDLPYYRADFTKSTLVVMGSEAHGPSTEVLASCDLPVQIPMPGQAESLNVGIAAGIILFEAIRQKASSG